MKIIVADQERLVHDGLVSLLAAENDFAVLPDCADFGNLAGIIAQRDPDVVLLVIDTPEQAGVAVNCLRPGAKARALLVTGSEDFSEIAWTFSQGVLGVFSKTSDGSQLPEAIRRVALGETWVDPHYLAIMIDGYVNPSQPAGNRCSVREREILALVRLGCGNKEIADRLHISEAAVKAGLQRLFQKHGIRSRAHLVAVTSRRSDVADVRYGKASGC